MTVGPTQTTWTLRATWARACHRTACPSVLVDLPAQQRRDLARWDPIGDGHLGVIGGSRSGRTTLVRTIITGLAQRLPPGELHVHVLEGTPGSLSDLATLPHVGSVVARPSRCSRGDSCNASGRGSSESRPRAGARLSWCS